MGTPLSQASLRHGSLPKRAEATGLKPNDSRELAIVLSNFEPGPYTAIVRGKNGTTGVGLVEIFDVQN